MLERIRERLFNKAVDLFGVNSKMAAIVQNDCDVGDKEMWDIIADIRKQLDDKTVKLQDWKIKSANWLEALQLYLGKK